MLQVLHSMAQQPHLRHKSSCAPARLHTPALPLKGCAQAHARQYAMLLLALSLLTASAALGGANCWTHLASELRILQACIVAIDLLRQVGICCLGQRQPQEHSHNQHCP